MTEPSSQPFPDGAVTRHGFCEGAFCRDQRRPAEVVRCRVGESWRVAVALELCADCLADFAVADAAIPVDVQVFTVDLVGVGVKATEIPHLRIYAEASDGLYHEVKGSLP